MRVGRFCCVVLLFLFGYAEAQRLPLFDAHIHYSGDAWELYSPDQALEILDQAGITRALVSSTPDDGTLRLYAAAPKRIVPVLRPYRSPADVATWHRDASVLPYVAERLRRGIYRGIGEFHLHGEDARSDVVREVVQRAGRQGLILHAHADDRAVETLFELDPGAKVLWAHAGMTADPDTVGRLLDRYRALWVELSIRSDIAPGGLLDPRWRALFLRHPGRFLYGTDTYSPARWSQVPAIAEAARQWLQQLPPDVAERIAHRNGAALFPE